MDEACTGPERPGIRPKIFLLLMAGAAPVLAGMVVILTLDGQEAALSFYATSAEILPLIVLAVVLERSFIFRPPVFAVRFRRPGTETPSSSSSTARAVSRIRRVGALYSVLLLLLLAGSEWAALDALATERPGEHHFALAAAGLAAGFTAIVVMALLTAVSEKLETPAQ